MEWGLVYKQMGNVHKVSVNVVRASPITRAAVLFFNRVFERHI